MASRVGDNPEENEDAREGGDISDARACVGDEDHPLVKDKRKLSLVVSKDTMGGNLRETMGGNLRDQTGE